MKIQTTICATEESDSFDDKRSYYNQQPQNTKQEDLETEESLLDFILFYASEIQRLKEKLVFTRLTEADKLRQHLIDSKKACKLLGISDRTLKTWRKEGIIPFVKIGKNAYYDPHKLEEKLDQNYTGETIS